LPASINLTALPTSSTLLLLDRPAAQTGRRQGAREDPGAQWRGPPSL